MRQKERTLIKEVVSIKSNSDMKVRVSLIFASVAPIFRHVGVHCFLFAARYLDDLQVH